jgi:hypothetical protein
MIDTHHHIYSPRYVDANLQRLRADTRALPATAYRSWSPKWALEQMDKANVRAAVVSMTSPGVWWNNGHEARMWARECNEFGAGMARDFPGRFGMFAALPLPDTEGSLREIAYALDTLKLDGVGLLTSYAGKPLGDASLAPVFDELNRRNIAVFVHPTMSCCGMSIPGVDVPAIDFPTDTTRAIASLAFGGAFFRLLTCRFAPPAFRVFVSMKHCLRPRRMRALRSCAALPSQDWSQRQVRSSCTLLAHDFMRPVLPSRRESTISEDTGDRRDPWRRSSCNWRSARRPLPCCAISVARRPTPPFAPCLDPCMARSMSCRLSRSFARNRQLEQTEASALFAHDHDHRLGRFRHGPRGSKLLHALPSFLDELSCTLA